MRDGAFVGALPRPGGGSDWREPAWLYQSDRPARLPLVDRPGRIRQRRGGNAHLISWASPKTIDGTAYWYTLFVRGYVAGFSISSKVMVNYNFKDPVYSVLIEVRDCIPRIVSVVIFKHTGILMK